MSDSDADGPRIAPVPVSVGHWTDVEAQTGCTVVVFDRPVLAAVDVRGGAPGTRETDLLRPERLVRRVDAILLTGGSAFGLAAADGVVRWLAERGRGFATTAGPVPIVPAAVIYDLAVGAPTAPDGAAGYRACEAAGPVADSARGRVGAGTGATVAKATWRPTRGGVGIASLGPVTAIVVVNAFGAVIDPGSGAPVGEAMEGDPRRLIVAGSDGGAPYGESSTLGVVLVAEPCDHAGLQRCAIAAHDGFARAIRPCHTPFDGDLVFAVGLTDGAPSPHQVLRLATAAELAVEQAIVDAVTA